MRPVISPISQIACGFFDPGETPCMQDFKKLRCWKFAHELSVRLEEVIEREPVRTHWKLIDQMIGAAASVPANIAEGAGRDGPREFCRFLKIALGSALELESHLLKARDRKCFAPDVVASLLADLVVVQKTTYGLLACVRRFLGNAKRGTGP